MQSDRLGDGVGDELDQFVDTGESMWVVVLECLAEDESKYLYESSIPVCKSAETPLEAVHWAIKRTAWGEENPCGIEEVRKVHREEVLQRGEDVAE